LKSACTRTGAVVNTIFKDFKASGLKENFDLPVFFSYSVSGAANVAKFFINRRYHDFKENIDSAIPFVNPAAFRYLRLGEATFDASGYL